MQGVQWHVHTPQQQKSRHTYIFYQQTTECILIFSIILVIPSCTFPSGILLEAELSLSCNNLPNQMHKVGRHPVISFSNYSSTSNIRNRLMGIYHYLNKKLILTQVYTYPQRSRSSRNDVVPIKPIFLPLLHNHVLSTHTNKRLSNSMVSVLKLQIYQSTNQ